MAKILTLSDAVQKFGALVTNGIDIRDAIQEAVDRVYEMGRWPGTTKEIELASSEFVKDGDLMFVYFDEQVYDGAIGFRTPFRGWSIRDHTALYKDGINSGDREFVDYGTVLHNDIHQRKYRCPLGFNQESGPYYALMKLEAPTLAEDDLIPFHSTGALKCAILAVCDEYANDDDRANLNWQKFDQFIKLAERQVEGPKKYYMGMDSSLRRRPKQFM